jgi:hypothetical protein
MELIAFEQEMDDDGHNPRRRKTRKQWKKSSKSGNSSIPLDVDNTLDADDDNFDNDDDSFSSLDNSEIEEITNEEVRNL